MIIRGSASAFVPLHETARPSTQL